MRRLMTLSCLLLPALAAAQDRVSAYGCPLPGAEPGCLVLRTGDGTLYDISEARPRPPVNGRALRITARRAGERLTYCQQGEPLAEISWEQAGQGCPGR